LQLRLNDAGMRREEVDSILQLREILDGVLPALQYASWCHQHHLRLFQARRADIECFARDLDRRHGRPGVRW